MTPQDEKPRNTGLNGAPAHPSYPWLNGYPANVDWFKTFVPMPLPTILDNAVARFGDRPATHFLGKELSYAELATAVNRAAKGLSELGVKKGVNIGLFLPNCPAFVIYYYAILKAGGTIVNFNPLYSLHELTHQAKDAEVTTLITLDLNATFPKAKQLLDNGTIKHVIVVPFRDMLPSIKGLLFSVFKRKDVAEWHAASVISSHDIQNNDGRFNAPTIELDDLAVLQYTGGTTGTPKGAMLSHANLATNVQQIGEWFNGLSHEGDESFLCVIPFFHVFAMTCLMNYAVSLASRMILLPRFELKQALKTIDQEKPTIMAGVPTLFNAIAKAPDISKYDLSSLKFCNSGGAPLPIEVKRDFERASGCKLVEGYGLSETSPVTHVNPPNGPVKEGSIGLPMPGTIMSLRDIDASDREVAQGEKGELCISGPQVMKGYWNKPQETKDCFVGDFFRTGDVATMDEQGFTFIVDRIKDLIIASGFNIYPRRIEEAIYEHAAVEEVTVIGIPDQYRGEAPKAFVKLRKNQKLTSDELQNFLKARLSKIEMPAEIEFRDHLPKTLIGKLSKKELKAEADKH